MIISGPNATLGNELIIVRNGSNTRERNLFHQRIVAMISDIEIEIINEINN